MRNIEILFIFLLLAGLFSSVSNYIYLSALPSVFFLVFFPLFFSYIFIYKRGKINKITFYTILFYMVSLLSVFFYDPAALLVFDFYRRDGNFIISYAPILGLVFFSLLSANFVQFDLKKIISYFLLFVVLVNIPLFLMYIYNLDIEAGNIGNITFGSLFVARNAAGGFFAVVLSFAVAKFLATKSRSDFIVSFIIFSFMIATYSRGSILAFFAALSVFFLYKYKKKRLVLLLLVFVILSQLIMVYEGYEYYQKDIDRKVYIEQHGLVDDPKTENRLARVLHLWPRAIDNFLLSPLIGAGFGSYNDYPRKFVEIIPLVGYFNTGGKYYDAGHAHHSYFHILAEQGVVGLLILILIWFHIYKYIYMKDPTCWVRNGLFIAFWVLIFASFTEHRITTPSNVLPFLLAFLLFYRWQSFKYS